MDGAELSNAGWIDRIPKNGRFAYTSGAICLSSSSNLAFKLYSDSIKPVVLPPGFERGYQQKPAADRIGDEREHDWEGAGTFV